RGRSRRSRLLALPRTGRDRTWRLLRFSEVIAQPLAGPGWSFEFQLFLDPIDQPLLQLFAWVSGNDGLRAVQVDLRVIRSFFESRSLGSEPSLELALLHRTSSLGEHHRL